MNKTAFADTASDPKSRLNAQEEELFDLFIEDDSPLGEGPYEGFIIESKNVGDNIVAYIRIPEIHDFILPIPIEGVYSEQQNRALKSMLITAVKRKDINNENNNTKETDYVRRKVEITFVDGDPTQSGKMRGAIFRFDSTKVVSDAQFGHVRNETTQQPLKVIDMSAINSQFMKSAPTSPQQPTDQIVSSVTKNDYVLLFGDSQMQGSTKGGATIGKLLEIGFKKGRSKQKTKEVVRVGNGGWTPAKYVSKFDSTIKSHLQKKPKLIIITLGGNGVHSKAKYATQLIQKIKSITPDSQIIWIGPPPPASDGTTYNKDGKLLEIRKKRNKILEDNISSKVNRFINSYKVDSFASGYSCNGACDGVHLPGIYASKFLKQAGLL